MEIIYEHREIAKLSATGVIAVLITGITVSSLSPETEIGRIIDFSMPILVGIMFAAKIYMKGLNKVEQKLDQ